MNKIMVTTTLLLVIGSCYAQKTDTSNTFEIENKSGKPVYLALSTDPSSPEETRIFKIPGTIEFISSKISLDRANPWIRQLSDYNGKLTLLKPMPKLSKTEKLKKALTITKAKQEGKLSTYINTDESTWLLIARGPDSDHIESACLYKLMHPRTLYLKINETGKLVPQKGKLGKTQSGKPLQNNIIPEDIKLLQEVPAKSCSM